MRDTAADPASPNITAPIAFIDLAAQRRRIEPAVSAAIARVLAHGAFVMGPEVAELESRLAAHCGTRHAVSCSSGTDALLMPLMAWGIGSGDAVLVPSFTFTATAEVAVLAGATPVFVDVDADTFNITAESLARGIAAARAAGLRPAVVIPVDLFGQPADYDALGDVAAAHGCRVLADAAQSYGASYKNRRAGALAEVTATSFYPSKPLGCYGDGGAVFTDDDALAARLRQIRVHGQGRDRNDNVCIGLTARLDTIQAAVLIEKLEIFDDECRARQDIAARYDALLAGAVITPRVAAHARSVWAQYTVRSPARDRIVAALAAEKIPTSVFYPKPIHVQPAYRQFPRAVGDLPVTERLARECVSLPMHPYLNAPDQERVAAAVRRAVA
ncbi:MAG: DegT/DnrJ/EryC1/StrS aminotransferase family protein [Rhodospirillaceae bacterium]|nr:DegT/DnrJ/EryC1/StrS aminotransferase family protein [Rhodospirillaceae bacterium]